MGGDRRCRSRYCHHLETLLKSGSLNAPAVPDRSEQGATIFSSPTLPSKKSSFPYKRESRQSYTGRGSNAPENQHRRVRRNDPMACRSASHATTGFHMPENDREKQWCKISTKGKNIPLPFVPSPLIFPPLPPGEGQGLIPSPSGRGPG